VTRRTSRPVDVAEELGRLVFEGAGLIMTTEGMLCPACMRPMAPGEDTTFCLTGPDGPEGQARVVFARQHVGCAEAEGQSYRRAARLD